MTTCKLNWLTADDKETALRVRPIREQWEARGPGLLGRLRTLLPWLEIPNDVNVHLIRPVVGGAGRVLSRGEIEFEAVLANPWPMLPEVVRLGWLIACCSTLPTEDHRDVQLEQTSLALIPPTVQASEHVELARPDALTFECALSNWGRFEVSSSDLMEWWQQATAGPIDESKWRELTKQL